MESSVTNPTLPTLPAVEEVATHWPVKRRWAAKNADNTQEYLRTDELAQFGALIVLGAAGMGKTVEIYRLATIERASGRRVAFRSLAYEATASGLAGLRARLDEVLTEVGIDGVIYLDALDEASVSIPMTAVTLQTWIRERLPTTASIRIACRSAVWPGDLTRAIGAKFGETRVRTIELQPLSEEEYLDIAEAEGADPTSFHSAVSASNVGILARQPLTLQILLDVFLATGHLPRSRVELFSSAIVRLASERPKRRHLGTATQIPVDQIIEVAERIAVISVLSGRQIVDRADSSSTSTATLHVTDLAALPRGRLLALSHSLIDTVLATSLFRGEGKAGAVFWHRQLAEYLAGRRLAQLPFHQAQALLSSGTERRREVAGPLRQTAVFAASVKGRCSAQLTEWLVATDPELIGQAEASDPLRRRALLEFLARFRRHQITAAQLYTDEISLHNLRYEGVENDLRPVLNERAGDLEDVHALALRLARDWELDALSDEIAGIVLDNSIPMNTRRSAGYALARCGTEAARRRLRPLAAGTPEDEDEELKGLALRCNWPGGFSVPELLGHLGSPGGPGFFGAYHGFFLDLEREGFDASDARIDGLKWAARILAQSRSRHPGAETACQIVLAALGHAGDPEVRQAVIDVLDRCERSHLSNLFEHHRIGTDSESLAQRGREFLGANPDVRHEILTALATGDRDRFRFHGAIRQLPGLLVADDFEWLLDQALSEAQPPLARERFADAASSLPWLDDPGMIRCWDRVRDLSPIREVFQMESTDLSSEAAEWRREAHRRAREGVAPRRVLVDPPPAERIRIMLAKTREDPRWFSQLAAEMTLEADSTTYVLNANPVRCPGWRDTDEPTRAEIVEAARQLLTVADDIPRASITRELNQSVADGGVPALLLIAEVDPNWLRGRPAEWWRLWAWFIVRELRIGLCSEMDPIAERLLELLWSCAPVEVREATVRLATTRGGDLHLRGLLERLERLPDEVLDENLCALLESGAVSSKSIATTMAFVLNRRPERAVPLCLRFARSMAPGEAEIATIAAVVLLRDQPHAVWSDLMEAFRINPAVAESALGMLASDSRPSRATVLFAGIGDRELGDLADLMMVTFPPELDPDRDDGSWSPRQDAALLRGGLIRRLEQSSSDDAVAALKRLESKYGDRNPWLRHPRAGAERRHRHQSWSPIEPRLVAEVLVDSDRRVVRSVQDVVDGLVAALEQCERGLHGSPPMAPALWDNARSGNPRPREEEWVSDWVLADIAKAFESRAVVASREAQIRRRQVPRRSGGAAGSDADILVKVPSTGTAGGEPISVVVEIKRSCNREARTGMRDQLAERYLPQSGGSHGVFVVCFMDAPGIRRTHRPIWSTIEEAREELDRQAADIEASTAGNLRISAIVLDCRLDGGNPPGRESKRQQPAHKKRRKKSSPMRAGKGGTQKKTLASSTNGGRRGRVRVKKKISRGSKRTGPNKVASSRRGRRK